MGGMSAAPAVLSPHRAQRTLCDMRAWIAYAAALLLFLSGLVFQPAAAEPSTDVAPGVAAYEAGDYERAYDLLKPAANAGDVQARYLMARLLSGDLQEKTDYAAALSFLDVEARCFSAEALNLYGFLLQNSEKDLFSSGEKVAKVYKEAARAGSIIARHNLGVFIIQRFQRNLEGAAYVFEAAQAGSAKSVRLVDKLKDQLGTAPFETYVVGASEKQPFEDRWPLLTQRELLCATLHG